MRGLLFLLFLCLAPFWKSYSIGDIYIDRVTGKQLGTDGSKTNNLRVIDIREWIYVLEEKGGPNSMPGIKELHQNSSVITFNEYQIQQVIQRVTDDTTQEGLENQLFIVLNVNNGRVYALRDWSPEFKTEKEIMINTYRIGSFGAPRIGEGLMLLGQLHSHPKENHSNKINIRSVSEHDVEAAKSLEIPVFAVDAFILNDEFDSMQNHKNSRTSYIHLVNKTGVIKKFIGQTYGMNGLNTFNFSKYFDFLLRKENEIQQYYKQIN
ncbi:hypothetical protein GCM10009430_20330 [Aquimarina litoralis]|uniref:Uncharacterized protein n=1 Tax=Aquimarina litoralis TaxID=584605 RepID=A0ABP3U1N0_9FLAO